MQNYPTGMYLEHILGEYYIQITNYKKPYYQVKVFPTNEEEMPFYQTLVKDNLSWDFVEIPKPQCEIGDIFMNDPEDIPDNGFRIKVIGLDWMLDPAEYPDGSFEPDWLYIVALQYPDGSEVHDTITEDILIDGYIKVIK